MTVLMSTSIHHPGIPAQHGPDMDEAKERKRLQNRIAQRKFRERKAQQQMMANAAAANTAAAAAAATSTTGKALQEMNHSNIPPEVLPWIGRLGSFISPTTTPSSHKLEGQSGGIKHNVGNSDDCFQCHTCGRQLFSILGDACICNMPTPHTPTRTASSHPIKNALGDHRGLTPPGDISTIFKSSPRDDDFSFDVSGFPTPVSMSVSQDVLQASHFMPEQGNNMPMLLPTQQHDLQSLSLSSPTTMHAQTKSIMSFFPEDSSHDSVSAMVSQTLSCAQEINAPLLHVAVFHGHCKIVQMLVEHKFDVNEQDHYGTTALHVAVQSRNENLVNYLVQHGANAYLSNHDGQNPLHLAVQIGFENAVRMFLGQHVARSSPS